MRNRDKKLEKKTKGKRSKATCSGGGRTEVLHQRLSRLGLEYIEACVRIDALEYKKRQLCFEVMHNWFLELFFFPSEVAVAFFLPRCFVALIIPFLYIFLI